MQADDDLQLPSTLAEGRFVLGEQLGRGSVSIVLAATDCDRDSAPAAVKLLHPGRVRDERLRSRFLREAEALASLEHPNVIRVHATGMEEDVAWLAMDRMVESCHQLAYRTGGVPGQRCLEIAEDVLLGLIAVHDRGWIHRDVKPGNLLIGPDQHVRLADFGVLWTEGSTLTQSDAMLGTARYMSPEQRIDPRRVGPPTDLYGLGASLVALALAAVPRNLPLAVERQAFLDKLPEELVPVVRGACQERPKHRFASARAMLEAVRDTLGR
jgi:serine/threonine-protein kinase